MYALNKTFIFPVCRIDQWFPKTKSITIGDLLLQVAHVWEPLSFYFSVSILGIGAGKHS